MPTEFEYTDGMTVAEIAKRIKREPAEIVKKLFMMGVMATQNQSYQYRLSYLPLFLSFIVKIRSPLFYHN